MRKETLSQDTGNFHCASCETSRFNFHVSFMHQQLASLYKKSETKMKVSFGEKKGMQKNLQGRKEKQEA